MDLRSKDMKILNVLHPEGRDYHLLPIHWILALAGRPYDQRTRTRMAELAAGGYLHRKKEWYKHNLYSHATRKAIKNIEKHQFIEDIVQASIELGARAAGFTYSDWQDIKDNMQSPATKAEFPRRIPLKDGYAVPDGLPFRLAKGDKQIFILGKEIDRDTEPNVSNTYRRSIRQKLKEYQQIFKDKIYKSHHGFQSALVIFVTISERKERAI